MQKMKNAVCVAVMFNTVSIVADNEIESNIPAEGHAEFEIKEKVLLLRIKYLCGIESCKDRS